MASSDEPRDEGSPDEAPLDDGVRAGVDNDSFEPGPRRSTYTPPPHFVLPNEDTVTPSAVTPPTVIPDAAAPADPPPPVFVADEPPTVDPPNVIYSLDDVPASNPFGSTPSAADYSSIFPNSYNSEPVSHEPFAPPVFPEFPDSFPEFPDSAYPPSADATDPDYFASSPFGTPFGAPSPGQSDFDPPVFDLPVFDAPTLDPPVGESPPGFETPPFDPSRFAPPVPGTAQAEPSLFGAPTPAPSAADPSVFEMPPPSSEFRVADLPDFGPPPTGSPVDPDAFDGSIFGPPPVVQSPIFQAPEFPSPIFQAPEFETPESEDPVFEPPVFEPSVFQPPEEFVAEPSLSGEAPTPAEDTGAEASDTEAPVDEPVSAPDPGPLSQLDPDALPSAEEQAAMLAQIAGPTSAPWIPRRRSLPDDVLASELSKAVDQPGMTLDAMDELERQLQLREEEAREYQDWEQSMLAIGTPEALATVESVRPEFEEIVAATTSIPIQYPAENAATPVDASDIPEVEAEEPDVAEAPAPPPLVEPLEPIAEPERSDGPPPLIEPPAAPPPPSLPESWEIIVSPDEPPAFGAVTDSPAPEEPNPLATSSLFSWATGDDPVADAATPASQQPPAEAAPAAAEPNPFDTNSLFAWASTGDPAPTVAPPVSESIPFQFGKPSETDASFNPFADLPTPADPAPNEADVAPLEFVEPVVAATATRSAADRWGVQQPVVAVAPAPEFVGSAAPLSIPAFVTEDLGAQPTPADQRVGRAVRLFWLWFAANSSIVSVAFGAILFSLGMSLREAVIAILAGIVLSFIPLGLGTLAGKRSGQPTMVISRATFGIHGNIVPALVALLSRLFWGAALMYVLAASVASALIGAQITAGLSRAQLVILCMGLTFILALLIAFFGYRLIARFQQVVSIISAVLIIGLIALTWKYVDFTHALSVPDGPFMLIVTGAVLVFSFVGLVWANSSSDLARYQRPGSSSGGSMLWATFGTTLPSFVLIAYGALLAASNADIGAGLVSNPLVTIGGLLPLWYPVPLIAATALSLLSGVVISIYSGSFAIAAIGIRAKQTVSVLVVALLVFGIGWLISSMSGDLTTLFRDFATTIAVPVAAWAGIFASEVMMRNRAYHSRSLLSTGGVYPAVRWSNLVAFVLITVVGFGFTSSTISWLSWQGFIAHPIGVTVIDDLTTADIGVVFALIVGLLVPIIGGRAAIRRQEAAAAELAD